MHLHPRSASKRKQNQMEHMICSNKMASSTMKRAAAAGKENFVIELHMLEVRTMYRDRVVCAAPHHQPCTACHTKTYMSHHDQIYKGRSRTCRLKQSSKAERTRTECFSIYKRPEVLTRCGLPIDQCVGNALHPETQSSWNVVRAYMKLFAFFSSVESLGRRHPS